MTAIEDLERREKEIKSMVGIYFATNDAPASYIDF